MKPLMLVMWFMVFVLCCSNNGKNTSDSDGGTDAGMNAYENLHNDSGTDVTKDTESYTAAGGEANSSNDSATPVMWI